MVQLAGVRITTEENGKHVTLFEKWICAAASSLPNINSNMQITRSECVFMLLLIETDTHPVSADHMEVRGLGWNPIMSLEWLNWFADMTQVLLHRYHTSSSSAQLLAGFLSSPPGSTSSNNTPSKNGSTSQLLHHLKHADACIVLTVLLDETLFPQNTVDASVSDGGCGWSVLSESTLLIDTLPRWIPPSDHSILSRLLSPTQMPSSLALPASPYSNSNRRGSAIPESKQTRLPAQLTSPIPWRQSGIQYFAQEHVCIDQVEHLNVMLNRHGKVVHGEVEGEIWCLARVSGMPDLLVTLANNGQQKQSMDEFQLHPCVRYSKFIHDRVLSFIPPDNHRVKLLSYTYLRWI